MEQDKASAKKVESNPVQTCTRRSGVWQVAQNVCRRSGGNLSVLSSRFQRRRLQKRAAESVLGPEEVSAFVSYLTNHHPDVLYNGFCPITNNTY